MSELSLRHPMLLTVHSTPRMLHAVVVTSVETIESDRGRTITGITFRDPELTRFLRSISSYYLVSIKS
jgi:hypothetical protein